MTTRPRAQCKVVARRANGQHITHSELLMDIARSSTALPLQQHRDHIALRFFGRVEQGIAAHKSIGQLHINVRAWREGLKGGATRGGEQFQADHAIGFIPEGTHAGLVGHGVGHGGFKKEKGRHMMESPPSTISVVPVMKDASSEASQRIGAAISSGSAQRPSSEVVCRSVLRTATSLPAARARAR